MPSWKILGLTSLIFRFSLALVWPGFLLLSSVLFLVSSIPLCLMQRLRHIWVSWQVQLTNHRSYNWVTFLRLKKYLNSIRINIDQSSTLQNLTFGSYVQLGAENLLALQIQMQLLKVIILGKQVMKMIIEALNHYWLLDLDLHIWNSYNKL